MAHVPKTESLLDASTLEATAFNVGMIEPNCFGNKQVLDAKINELVDIVAEWLPPERDAVVGLNEIVPEIGGKLMHGLEQKLHCTVDFYSDDTNIVLWRTPQ